MVDQLIDELNGLRVQRAENFRYLLDDPANLEMTKKLIADTITVLELLYIRINLPSDGFISLSPNREG